MSELVTYSGDPTGGRLVAWAEAAKAAHSLALALVRTAVVPESYRAKNLDRNEVERAAADAAAAILLGDELGLSPIAALRSIYVIKGQPAMYALTMVALVMSRGHRVWTESESAESVTVAGHRAGDPEHVERSTWTMHRARAEGLTRNRNYGEHPAQMLYARAASTIARRVAPDVLLGVPETTAEELGGTLLGAVVDSTGERVVRRAAVSRSGSLTGAPPTPARADAGREGSPVLSEGEPTDETAPSSPLDAPQTPPTDLTGTTTLPDDSEPADGDGDVEPPEPGITSGQRALIQSGFRALGLDRDGPEGYIARASRIVGRRIESTNDLTVTEASFLIDTIEERRRRLAPGPGEAAAADDDGTEPDAYRGADA